MENLKKALISGKGSAESAIIACVQLCKASTYITREDNVVSFLVAEVLNELKVSVFECIILDTSHFVMWGFSKVLPFLFHRNIFHQYKTAVYCIQSYFAILI